MIEASSVVIFFGLVLAFEAVFGFSKVMGIGILGRGSFHCDILVYGGLLNRWSESFSLSSLVR